MEVIDMNKYKRIAAAICAAVIFSIMCMSVSAEENPANGALDASNSETTVSTETTSDSGDNASIVSTDGTTAADNGVTDFDWSMFDGLFEDTGDSEVNVIGDIGAVNSDQEKTKPVDTGNAVGDAVVTVNITCDKNIVLLGRKSFDLKLLQNDVPISVATVRIADKKATLAGIEDGEYVYSISDETKQLVFSEGTTTGTINISGGEGEINLEMKAPAMLRVFDSAGSADFEFADIDTAYTYNEDGEPLEFVVIAGERYKVRKVGDTDFTIVEVPTMAKDYVFDLTSKQASLGENFAVMHAAELPDENKSEDNPYNIPPTLDIDDTHNAGVQNSDYIILGVIALLALFVLIVKNVKRKRNED